jgi:hypothetical protein
LRPGAAGGERAGCNLQALGRYGEAETLLLESLGRFQRGLGAGHGRTRGALRRLEQLNRDWGRPEEAARYAALLAGE